MLNYSYLLNYITNNSYSNVRHYDCAGKLKLLIRPDERMDDDALAGLILSNQMASTPSEMPILFSINKQLVYSLVFVPDGLFILGPTVFAVPLSLKYDISADPVITGTLLPLIPLSNSEPFVECVAMLSNMHRTGKDDTPFIPASEIINENVVFDLNTEDSYSLLYGKTFENVENSFAHNPYNHEHRERVAIKKGDVDELKKILRERFPGRYGVLSKDPLKQEIYMGIVAVTIASRAAIDGGLHPETAFSLSDVTINKLDACKNPDSAIRITHDAEIKYASLVAELNEEEKTDDPLGENRHISHCKDYVFAHLHGRLTVQEIADAISLDPNYLSSLFKKCTGVSLKQYIRHQKIKLVKNLLTYSSYSYGDIAAYLGFASQSHMGQEFKKETGVTPRAYRERNASEDFMNDTI